MVEGIMVAVVVLVVLLELLVEAVDRDIDSTLSNAATSTFAASSDTDRGTAGSVDNNSRIVINDTFIDITQQPVGAAVLVGDTHTFSVTAAVNDVASTTINYQWQKKISGTWTDISGATSSSYTTPAILLLIIILFLDVTYLMNFAQMLVVTKVLLLSLRQALHHIQQLLAKPVFPFLMVLLILPSGWDLVDKDKANVIRKF